jgi:hypothetical protein
MKTAVTSLRAILEIVEREPSAMAEVQLRFTAKKPVQKVLSLKATCSGPFQKNQELITLMFGSPFVGLILTTLMGGDDEHEDNCGADGKP